MKIIYLLMQLALAVAADGDELAESLNENELLSEPFDDGESVLSDGLEWDYDDLPIVTEPLDDEDDHHHHQLEPIEEAYAPLEIEGANRVNCPFHGGSCRFKKAKCTCKSEHGDFKFTMKKFKMLPNGDSTFPQSSESQMASPQVVYPQTGEPLAMDSKAIQPAYGYHQVPHQGPIIQEIRDEPSDQEIMGQVPGVIEGLKSVEQAQDPRQILMPPVAPNGAGQAPDGVPGGFEDRTIRVRTEDVGPNNKVHEYEYLRVKNVDENGVAEKHIETPEDINPAVAYHKGVMSPADLSLKKQISQFTGQRGAHGTDFDEAPESHPQGQSPSEMTPFEKVRRKMLEVEQKRHEVLSGPRARITSPYYEAIQQSPASAPLAIEYHPDHNKVSNVETVQRLETPTSRGASRTVPLNSTTGAVVPYTQGFPENPLDQVQDMSLAPFHQSEPRLRGLKRSKSKKKKNKNKRIKGVKRTKDEKREEKLRRKEEKRRKKELKKKARIARSTAEKRELARLEEMKEKERILEEKLDKEREELEERQIAATEKARIAKRLQLQKDLQERRIAQTERSMQIKRQRRRQMEERARLQRLRTEQRLIKEQQGEVEDMERDAGSMGLDGPDELDLDE